MAPLTQAPHFRYDVREEEDVGVLRRAVASVTAQSSGVQVDKAVLIATELATNLIRHATSGGYILVCRTVNGVEFLSIDNGPGMRRSDWRDAARSAQHDFAIATDHRSLGLGVGLLGVERMCSSFDIYSARSSGTVVLARIESTSRPRSWCEWGAVNVPTRDERVSGDAWAVRANGSLRAVVVDGLGHGIHASASATIAVDMFNRQSADTIETYITHAHESMLGTRGAVIGVCSINPTQRTLHYIGVGNISGRLLVGSESHHLLSRDGSVGTHVQMPTLRVATYGWEPGATLILATDGLRSQWDPRAYSGLLEHEPTVVAAVLQRDFRRENDDAAVLVIQDRRKST